LNNCRIIFLLRLIVSGALILLFGCSKTKLLTHENSSPYLNYDKVRFTLNLNQTVNSFRGSVYLVKDSSACYRFSGPLGIELGYGSINKDFVFYDAVHNYSYRDLKTKIENLTGLIINKQIILNLLTGSVSSLSAELLKLNKDLISIKDINDHYLELHHNISQSDIYFKYRFKDGYPVTIFLRSKANANIFELKMEIVEISFEKKICRFKD
jgi:hypothetical protein